ncbi:hypothetical protein M5X11_18780 [Paenibacillus alginolyticus]|uniref:hypothetical protein n=1 Tax=Paenibacillus alginolyticus TaxID=59839 RepID=UPI0004925556|nr:hypothetical protein [Paenibacillus alginolyticus]MCY9666953.1 hypothetical protein [Paenibacillus alginolyticus]
MRKRKLIGTSLLTLCISITLSVSVFADTYYHTTGFGNSASNLKYWKDSSVSTYGYTSKSDTGALAWNGISSNLAMTEVSSIPTYFSIVTYVGTSLAGLDVYGVADYWTYGLFGWTQVNPDDLRDRARVRMDDTNLKSLNDSTKVQYAFTHEFGHAVGLKHDNDSGVASVTRDSSIVWSNNMPQQIDKDHIKQKYGN